jgi:serine/threonine-protein kinase
VGESDGKVFIAMELVEGESLAKLVSGERPFSLTEGLQIIYEVARGLHKAHEIGVIHRDLKPDNIIVGAEGIVKILDFGVAKRLDTFEVEFTDIKTQHGSLVGTPAYMSPEQAAGKEVDARSDIFSLGVVLYEMLTARRPFEGDTWQETIIAINRDAVVPASQLVPEVPPEVDHIIARCLAKRVSERYPSCKELLDDLSALVMSSVTGTFPPGMSGILHGVVKQTVSSDHLVRDRTSTVTAPPSRRYYTAALVALTAAATVAVGLAFIDDGDDQAVGRGAVSAPVATAESPEPAASAARVPAAGASASPQTTSDPAPPSSSAAVAPALDEPTPAEPEPPPAEPAQPKAQASSPPGPKPAPSPAPSKNPLLGF